MDVNEFNHVVWCDLEIVLLKIHSSSPWDTKMVSISHVHDASKPTVNIYICREDDSIFNSPETYRENIMRRGSYRGHHFGRPASLKFIDDRNIALFHPDPGTIIWTFVIKYVLTVYALRENLLHIKGGAVAFRDKAFLFLGRGGSGKTEMVKALCENGAGLVANTHLLVDTELVCGIKTNIRVRDSGRDVYVPANQNSLYTHASWLPIGGIFWIKYRTDGRSLVEHMPPSVAKANLRYFSEAIANWEIKEDIADYFSSGPSDFAREINQIDKMLNDLCDRNRIYHLELDIFSEDGMERLMSVIETSPE